MDAVYTTFLFYIDASQKITCSSGSFRNPLYNYLYSRVLESVTLT